MTTNTVTAITHNTPKIFIQGVGHGDWINLSSNYDIDELELEISEILELCEKPDEYKIYNHKGFYGLVDRENFRNKNLDKILEVANFINEKHPEIIDYYCKALSEFKDYFGNYYSYLPDFKSLVEKFDSNFLGCYDDKEEFCNSYLESSGIFNEMKNVKIPMGQGDTELLSKYIDWESVVRDWEYNSVFIFIPTNDSSRIYVFSNPN